MAQKKAVPRSQPLVVQPQTRKKAVPGRSAGHTKRELLPTDVSPNPLSPKDQTHYCRTCALTITGTNQRTAHALTIIHQDKYDHHYIHPVEPRCDRSCSARQQGEEETFGRMLYGNIPRPKKTRAQLAESQKRIDLYEKLFPPEED